MCFIEGIVKICFQCLHVLGKSQHLGLSFVSFVPFSFLAKWISVNKRNLFLLIFFK